MKTNNEICHDFAHSWKESEQGGNIFYTTDRDGARTLYSYGYHFAIAVIKGGNVYFTTRTYSNTTAKHISNARGALSHRDLIFCPHPENARLSFEAWERELFAADKRLARARDKGARADEIRAILAQITRFCEASEETAPAYVDKYARIAETQTASPEAVTAANEDKKNEKRARIQRAEWAREARERNEARERARRLTSAERVQAWEQGENVFLSWEDTSENVPLRVESRKGYQVVKTGKGVTVTIEAARRFYRALCAGEIRTGVRVDTSVSEYTAGETTPETVRVGCHTWKREYLDRFYKVIENL